MCGRFAFTATARKIAEHFGLGEAPELAPRYNIAPSQMIPAVRRRPESEARELAMLRWGLVPFWAKDVKIGYKMINARAEGVSQKPAFRSAFQKRRCLIPADGFYEWARRDKVKQPYFVRMRHQEILAFAGLWDCWKGQGEAVESCTIITTDANALVGRIHDRMPVILHASDYDAWLDPATPSKDLVALLKPLSAEETLAYPVSPHVNSPANEDPSCLEPVGPELG